MKLMGSGAASSATTDSVLGGVGTMAAVDAAASSLRRGDDTLLVGRAINGDTDAYRVLVEKYQQRMYAVAFEIVRSREDAEDVVQDAFVKAYTGLAAFRADASFYTWLCRIVYHGAIDFQRRRTRRGGVADEYNEDMHSSSANQGAIDVHGSIEGPETAVVRRENAREIQTVLDGLSAEHRAVIMLREVDGLSYDEIADVVKVSRGTIMSRIHYARKYLQKALAHLVPGAAEVSETSNRSAPLNKRGGRDVSSGGKRERTEALPPTDLPSDVVANGSGDPGGN